MTLLAELPLSRMVAVDLAPEALGCARLNAEQHHVTDRLLPALCRLHKRAQAGGGES